MYRWNVRFRAKMHALFARLVIAPIEQDHILAEQRWPLPTKEPVRRAIGSERQPHRGLGRSPREGLPLGPALDDDRRLSGSPALLLREIEERVSKKAPVELGA